MSLFLKVEYLSVVVNNKQVLSDFNLEINKNEKHLLMGPNGAGKSTIANVLMGNPMYKITKGKIIFNGKNISKLSPDKRAKLGFFLSFQNPLSLPNAQIFSFLKKIYETRNNKIVSVGDFEKVLKEKIKDLKIDFSFIFRDYIEGFSGGERKKFELLQFILLNPIFAIFDELEAGLDADSIKAFNVFVKNKKGTYLIISHNPKILDNIYYDAVHIIRNGKIVKSGDKEIINLVNRSGYKLID